MIGANAHLYIPFVTMSIFPTFAAAHPSAGAFRTFSAAVDAVPVVYSVGVPPDNIIGIRCTWSFTLSVCKSLSCVQVVQLRYQSFLFHTRYIRLVRERSV